MNELKAWLKTQHFNAGVNLLRKYQPDHEMIARLSMGVNPTNRVFLEKAIRELIRAYDAAPTRAEKDVPVIAADPEIQQDLVNTFQQMQEMVKQAASEDEPMSNLPPEIVQAYDKRRKLVNQRNKLSNQLRGTSSATDRALMVTEMKAIHAEIQPITDLIEHFNKTGELDKSKPKSPDRKKLGKRKKPLSSFSDEEVDDLKRRIRNLQINIHKRKRGIKAVKADSSMSEEEREAKAKIWEIDLKKKEEEMQQLETELYG